MGSFSKFLTNCLIVITATSIHADEDKGINTEFPVEELDTDQELLDELLGIVDESTEIATNTRMNTNFVPGTVTVLQGKDLEELGVTTAWDALALVPGILPTKDPTGGTSVIARGINFPFSSGNVKILVNSLSMSQESSGINSTILQIPIEQIQRIEVVRGPGAILYGDNAFMGLINIVTYSEEQRLFFRYESDEAFSGGAMGSYKNEAHQLKINANVYGYGNNKADSPNNIQAEEDRQFGIVSMAYQGLSFDFQSFHRNYQQTNQGFSKEGNDIFNVRQLISITPTLKTQLNFSYLINDFQRANSSYTGNKMEWWIDVNWTGLKNHNWWLKSSYTSESIDDAFLRLRTQPGRPFSRPLHLTDVTRNYFSLSLQDQYDITNYLALTVGLRYDYRDDIDEHIFTPRVSAVWRVTDEHILKFQYAQGYRVPTFFELYTQTGQNDLSEEKIATTEASYIYTQTAYTGKVTFFYSQLSDMIFPIQNNFSNRSEAQSWGVEVEWSQQITNYLRWQANFSYVDTWDTRTQDGSKQEDIASANWLSNISLFYQPIDKVVLAGHWHYTGPRDSLEQIALPAENRLAFTISTFDIFTEGLGIKLGVQNTLGISEQYINVGPQDSNVLDYGSQATVWTQISYQL